MFRRYLIASAALTALAAVPMISAASASDTYKLDPAHTTVLFATDHLGFSNMIGTFNEFEGSFMFNGTSPADASVEVVFK